MLFTDLDEAGAQESAVKSKKIATNPNHRALALKLDVTSKTDVQKAVDVAIQEFGRIDYGVHCAGVSRSR